MVSGYQPRMFFGRNHVVKLEPNGIDSSVRKISAKKNLFLETGWYRPNNQRDSSN